jgi:hypothetical protein
MTYYKWLLTGRKPAHGGHGVWPRKAWLEVKPPIIPCEHGLHVCEVRDLTEWIPEKNGVLWEVEVHPDAEVVRHTQKSVVSKARLVRVVGRCSDRKLRLFACDCAERVLPLYEKKYPDDPRPRTAIETARRYANGKAGKEELDAAWAAARAAAWDAAGAAARAAAWAAARAAVWDAARAAAWDAARQWQGEHLIAVLSEP